MDISLTPEEQFEIFGTDKLSEHTEEAERRWGDADAWTQSQRRIAAYTRDDWIAIRGEADGNIQAFADALGAGEPATTTVAMQAAETHREHISRWFYDCGYDQHSGLAELYVADPQIRTRLDLRSADPEHGERNPMSRSSAQVMQELADAFNSRDFDRLPELVGGDADFEDVAAGEVVHGAAAIADYMRMWAGAFSDMRLEALAIVGDDSHVAGEFWGRGTHDGPLASPGGEIPATGRRMEERFTWFGEVQNGQLTGLRDYYNAMSMMTQLGLMPAPSAAS